MKTRVYIDGYNLYFGCLKHTPYKWLDLRQMIENLITRSGLPNAVLADIDPIKYITAEINPKAAADINSLNDQLSYHKALYLYSPEVKIIKGSYSIERNRYPLVQLDKHQKELEPRNNADRLTKEAFPDNLITFMGLVVALLARAAESRSLTKTHFFEHAEHASRPRILDALGVLDSR